MVTPIFLLSLPRAGSTLTQRILATSPFIATSAEPWLLLPVISAVRPCKIVADYDHNLCRQAVSDFCQTLEGGINEYLRAVRRFAEHIYNAASHKDALYFLDKTPRYSLVASYLFDIFPDARFIFLWRNPLAIATSMTRTWAGGRWDISRYNIDLFNGLEALLGCHMQRRSNAISIRYEELVTDPVTNFARLFAFLNLPFDRSALENFGRIQFAGQMGDPTGTKLYADISSGSVDRWLEAITNPIRRTWCYRYLDWIGEERLAMMGYDAGDLYGKLDSLPFKIDGFLGDMRCMLASYIRTRKERL